MGRIFLFVGLILFALIPARAAEEVSGFDRALESAMIAIQKGDGVAALKSATRALNKASSPTEKGNAHFFRAIALMLTDRGDAAYEASKLAIAMGGSPQIAEGLFNVGTAYGDTRIARLGADRLIAVYPANARSIEVEVFWPFIRLVRKAGGEAEADDYLIAFAKVGIGANNQTNRDYVAKAAASVSLKRSDATTARALAANVLDAEVLAGILTERKFEPLWSEIGERIGPRMEFARQQHFILAQSGSKDAPESVQARRNLVTAAKHVGSYAVGDEAGKLFAATVETTQAIEEDGGWLVNDHAILLRVMKRNDDADSRFAALRAINIEEAPWLINMIINRVEFLVRDANYRKAAPLLKEAEMLTKTYGSPYARQLIRRLKLCAAAETGGEVGPLKSDLIAHGTDSRIVTAEGLLCIGDDAGAAELVIAGLRDKDDAEGMVGHLQPPETVKSGDPSQWRERVHGLLKREDVKSAFDTVGRVLPRQYWTAEP